MQSIDKQAILDVLNSLEVIEQEGGESAYLLVKNNVENHKKLNAVGVPSKTINNYGDKETFCILALALSEGYADHYNAFKGGLVLEPENRIEIETSNASGINDLCKQAYETAVSKGWHDQPREMGTLLALIHSEVSEALEADRKGDTENFTEELADVCIRIFDLCGSRNINLEQAIIKKMERNKGRSYKHGGKAY
ncbi:MazG nucleotide pyrophosphohydrolase domain-containing protein [Lysinibacillus sp. C5.1]|uniref:MazG nucleotide pyrophosphohydrolase domain-containing protein n=1 Tax=Lysinibacillus sp. C5.1 TaxID=2796169 RepID=UPI0030816FFF